MRGFMLYILSQVLVAISDVLCIISMLTKSKKGIVFFLLLSTILFGSHYICLSAYTGAVIAGVELVFLIVMYILELKGKTQYNKLCSIITICTTIILSIVTWDTWLSVLPMLAMVIYLTAMMFTNVIIVKGGTFIRLTLNGIYMLLLKSYFGAGLTIAILAFTIYGILRDYKASKVVDVAE
jgi:hypothetical protein